MVKTWFDNNSLAIKMEKTKYIHFRIKKTSLSDDQIIKVHSHNCRKNIDSTILCNCITLLNILKDFKFPRKNINLIGASLNHTDIQVKIGNVTSRPTTVKTELRQRDDLSPVLFI